MKFESHFNPDSKVQGANMWPTWVLSSPGGPHVDPVNFAILEAFLLVELKMQFAK